MRIEHMLLKIECSYDLYKEIILLCYRNLIIIKNGSI